MVIFISLSQAQQTSPHVEKVMKGLMEEQFGEDNRSADLHANHDIANPSGQDHNEVVLVKDPHTGPVVHDAQPDHNMTLDSGGMLMASNQHALPEDCTKIVADYNFEVYAGIEFASKYPGTIYGFSQHEYVVEPCSSVTIKFINTDDIRHQWMIHGLPRYLYPSGMFHIEAAGGESREGTFIIPSDDKTYLVHCDMAQHMEMGMKGQLKAGVGSGDLWSVPGVSRSFRPDIYLPKASRNYLLLALFAGAMLTIVVQNLWRRR